MLNRLNKKANQSKGKIKSSIDRSIMRISDALYGDHAHKYFLNELNHSRKIRRLKAYKALQAMGAVKEYANTLVRIYSKTKDQKELELIAREQGAIKNINFNFLLENLEDEYWRMRVIETLLDNEEQKINITELTADFPWEFVYAIGRKKLGNHIGIIKKIMDENKSDYRVLSIAAWTCGKLQTIKVLEEIKLVIENYSDKGV